MQCHRNRSVAVDHGLDGRPRACAAWAGRAPGNRVGPALPGRADCARRPAAWAGASPSALPRSAARPAHRLRIGMTLPAWKSDGWYGPRGLPRARGSDLHRRPALIANCPGSMQANSPSACRPAAAAPAAPVLSVADSRTTKSTSHLRLTVSGGFAMERPEMC